MRTPKPLCWLVGAVVAALLVALAMLMPVVSTAATPAPTAQATNPPRTLRVAILITRPPFVHKTDTGYSGLAMDIWQKISLAQNWGSVYTVVPKLSEGLRLVETGKADVFISNLSITSARRKLVDFSQPYFDSGLQIMVDSDQANGAADLWHGLVANGHIRVFVGGTLLIILAALIATFLERRFNPEFPKEWPHGVAESLYNVASVVFSGKTNHKPLPGPLGKLLQTFWLIAGVASVAYVTSAITSVMTANVINGTINGPADLAHKRVGTKEDSTAETYLRSLNLQVSVYPDIDDAIHALEHGSVRAVVFDFPTLRYYAEQNPDEHVSVVGSVFDAQAYGFAMALGSNLREPIDYELLQLRESGFVDELKNKYFGAN